MGSAEDKEGELKFKFIPVPDPGADPDPDADATGGVGSGRGDGDFVGVVLENPGKPSPKPRRGVVLPGSSGVPDISDVW